MFSLDYLVLIAGALVILGGVGGIILGLVLWTRQKSAKEDNQNESAP